MLENWLEHLGVLLDQLAQLLEVGVVPQEVQVRKGFATRTARTASVLSPSLSSRLKQIDWLVTSGRRKPALARRSLGGWRGGGSGGGGSLLLLLLLLDVLGDTLSFC